MAKYLHMRCPTPTSIHSNSHGNTPSRKAPFTPGIGDETNETTRNTEAIVHKKSVSHKRNESLSDRKDVLKISKCGSTTPQRKKSVKGRISSAVRNNGLTGKQGKDTKSQFTINRVTNELQPGYQNDTCTTHLETLVTRLEDEICHREQLYYHLRAQIALSTDAHTDMHAADKQLEEVLRSAVSGGGVRVLEVSDDPKERTIARILTHSVSIGVIRKAMLVVMAYPRDYMPIDRSKYIDSLLFAAETPGKIQAVLQVFPGAPLREKMSQEWTRTYVVTGTRRGSYTDTQEDAGLSTGTQTDHTHTDDTCTHTHTHGQTSGVQSVSIQTSASREAHGCYDDRGTHKSAGTIWEGSGQVVASGSILERDGLRSASTRNTNKVGTGEKTVVLTDHVIGEPLKYG